MMKGADKMKEKELLKLGYKKYEGETYVVYFNKDICKHSGNCVKSNHTVFQLKRKPWVLPVATEQESALRAIKGCPSGALKYKLKNSDDIEP